MQNCNLTEIMLKYRHTKVVFNHYNTLTNTGGEEKVTFFFAEAEVNMSIKDAQNTHRHQNNAMHINLTKCIVT